MRKTRRIRRSRLRRKRSSTSKRSSRHSGGTTSPIEVKVTYYTTTITNNQDLTNQTELYKKPLTIILSNTIPNKKYLVVMVDPDAPAGTWTHYAAVYTAGEHTAGEHTAEVYYPYEPPSPLPGTNTHHYIFRVYDATDTDVSNLEKKNGRAGNVYYKQVLVPIIKNKEIINNEMQFIVKAPPA